MLLSGTRDTNHLIKIPLGARLKQQGNHHHPCLSALVSPSGNLLLPQASNSRMKDRFKLTTGHLAAKNAPGQLRSQKRSVRSNDSASKEILDFHQRRLSRLDDAPRQVIGIDDIDTVRGDHGRNGGFAHTDAAC